MDLKMKPEDYLYLIDLGLIRPIQGWGWPQRLPAGGSIKAVNFP